MAIETDADRAIFVNADDFGVSIIWISGSGSHAPVSAIFDDTFIAISAGDIDFQSDGATVGILLRTSDLPADAAQDDVITIGAKSYKAVSFRPDGTGMTTVRLQEM